MFKVRVSSGYSSLDFFQNLKEQVGDILRNGLNSVSVVSNGDLAICCTSILSPLILIYLNGAK